MNFQDICYLVTLALFRCFVLFLNFILSGIKNKSVVEQHVSKYQTFIINHSGLFFSYTFFE